MNDPRQAVWHLYVVLTRSGTLYTGIACDVERRFAEHAADGPRAARYLRGKGPLVLVYRPEVGTHGSALRAEHAFKRLSRVAKQRLLASRPGGEELLRMLGVDVSE